MKKKVGRPFLAPEQRRKMCLQIRVSATERNQLEASAKAEGKTASEWARKKLLTSISG